MFRMFGGDVVAYLLGLGYGLFAGTQILGVSRLGKTMVFLRGSRVLLFTMWIQGGLAAVIVFASPLVAFYRSKVARTPVLSLQSGPHARSKAVWLVYPPECADGLDVQ